MEISSKSENGVTWSELQRWERNGLGRLLCRNLSYPYEPTPPQPPPPTSTGISQCPGSARLHLFSAFLSLLPACHVRPEWPQTRTSRSTSKTRPPRVSHTADPPPILRPAPPPSHRPHGCLPTGRDHTRAPRRSVVRTAAVPTSVSSPVTPRAMVGIPSLAIQAHGSGARRRLV